MSCEIGICLSHRKDILKGHSAVQICADMEGRFIQSKKVIIDDQVVEGFNVSSVQNRLYRDKVD